MMSDAAHALRYDMHSIISKPEHVRGMQHVKTSALLGLTAAALIAGGAVSTAAHTLLIEPTKSEAEVYARADGAAEIATLFCSAPATDEHIRSTCTIAKLLAGIPAHD